MNRRGHEQADPRRLMTRSPGAQERGSESSVTSAGGGSASNEGWADSAVAAQRVGSGAVDTLSPVGSAPTELVEGAQFGRFRIEQRLGAGAMGVVYVAHDTQLGRRVAVKVLRNQSGPAEARLLREAQVMARLAHPNVVVLYDAGMVAGQMFIAMELVEGETLAAWLERRHSWQEVLERFLQSGRGLAAAHASGIVHRDFKPANVLVGTDGRARVLDFGVAREASELGTSPAPVHEGGPGALTETGTILGTPAYMAPEQRRGERATEASDQFSFCVSLWEGLAGARPGD